MLSDDRDSITVFETLGIPTGSRAALLHCSVSGQSSKVFSKPRVNYDAVCFDVSTLKTCLALVQRCTSMNS